MEGKEQKKVWTAERKTTDEKEITEHTQTNKQTNNKEIVISAKNVKETQSAKINLL